MSNDYYNPSGAPGNHSPGSSNVVRNEYVSIGQGFDKMAPLSGNGNKLIAVNSAGNAQEAKSVSEVLALLGLEIGVNVQAWNATLDELAATTPTALGKTLLQAVDAAAARTAIGAVGTSSPTFTGTPTVPTAALGTANTIAASTGFVQNALDNLIESGTKMAFFQASPPTGWSLYTTGLPGDYMMLINNASGGTIGGSDNPVLNDKVPAHQHGVSGVTVSTAPDHQHEKGNVINNVQSGGGTQCISVGSGSQTGAAGAHPHTLSGDVDVNASAGTWQPRHAVFCIGVKD